MVTQNSMLFRLQSQIIHLKINRESFTSQKCLYINVSSQTYSTVSVVESVLSDFLYVWLAMRWVYLCYFGRTVCVQCFSHIHFVRWWMWLECQCVCVCKSVNLFSKPRFIHFLANNLKHAIKNGYFALCSVSLNLNHLIEFG